MRIRSSRRQRLAPSHSTPLFVTLAILICWHVTRLGLFCWAIAARCVPNHVFWFSSYHGSWPLAASAALMFYLIFVWNAVCWMSTRGWLDRTILLMNAASLVGIGIALHSLFANARIEYYAEQGKYSSWNVTRSYFERDDPCTAARPFLGRWNVTALDAQPWAEAFPKGWIELRSDLTFVASDSLWSSRRIHGYWRPPGRFGGWFSTKGFDAVLDFSLHEIS